MPNFMIGEGHGLEVDDLEAFTPYQPLTPGIQYTRRTPTPGGPVKEGAYYPFLFTILTEEQWQDLLTQCGLLSADTAEVTIYAQDENYDWLLYDGEAIKPPLAGRRGFHLRDMTINVIKLQARP